VLPPGDAEVRARLRPSARRSNVLPLLALALVGCSDHERVTYKVVSPPRDWSAHPAVVEMNGPATIYAMSDVHGGYDRMVALLVVHQVIERKPPTPGDVRWIAGQAVLVVAGDLMDKGPFPLEAIDLLRALQPQAALAGGRVIFTLGNHEAEFLSDPENDKAASDDGVNHEIYVWGLSPIGVASGNDPRGQWLRDQPFAARVGDWFFAHAGNTHGRSVADLERALRTGITTNDYADGEAVGADSILESRDWYSGNSSTAAMYAAALGVRHIVFGHQPSALGPRGEIAVGFGGALFRIDCGMSPHVGDSLGRMLRIRRDGSGEVAESLSPDGKTRELWRGP
jgi:Calcineurin-like phosphoesterase